MLSTLAGDYQFLGAISAKTINQPLGSISDAEIQAGAPGNYIEASKVSHKHIKTFAQDFTTTAVAERRVVHVVHGATATVEQFQCGAAVAAIGGATATIDLKKNGTTILTGTISLTSATAAFASLFAAGFTSTALVAGDVLEIAITAVASGGGTLALGVFAQVTLYEDPA